MSNWALDPHWRPPRSDRVGPGAALSLLVHAGLVVALALGLHWRNAAPPSTISAELWASVPQAAAPTGAAPPAPAAAALPVLAPTRPTPAAALPPPSPTNPRDADIATERAAKIREAEQAARDAAQRAAARQAAQKQAAQQLAAQQQAAQEQLRKAKAEALKQAQAAQAAQVARASAATQAEDASLAKGREENLKRMLAQAGSEANKAASPVAGATANAAGNANRDMAPSVDLAGRIRAKVKANIIDTSAIQGNPVAEVEVRCSTDGSITSRRISKSSGNPAWDDTVLRALDKTRSLPREADGRIPAAMILVFSARE